MFDRIAGPVRPHELGHDGGPASPVAPAGGCARRAVSPGGRALDVATGTGDLALELAARVDPDGEVIGVDFSERMLERARAKAAASEETSGALPDPGTRWRWRIADDEFDAATVGFGARNFSDLERGMSEMARVVRPGGRVVVLEITTPRRPPLSTFFRIWFDRIVPALGRDRRLAGLQLPAELGQALPGPG